MAPGLGVVESCINLLTMLKNEYLWLDYHFEKHIPKNELLSKV